MFLVDTNTILMLNRMNKCFPFPFIISNRVKKELEYRKFKMDEIGSCFLIIEMTANNIVSTDQEIVKIKELLSDLLVVTEDYHLRKKTKGISARKIMFGR